MGNRSTTVHRSIETYLSYLQRNWVLITIILIGAFLRLYNIPNTVQFLGDQGRDAIIVSNIFTKGDLVFIGPVTSVGNLYLGPLYYYFMLPFLWLTYPSPLGPVYAVALLSILTTFLMYQFGKEMFSKNIALVAASLFALSSTVITYARFSWNPNPAPLVAVCTIYGVWKSFDDARWWIVVAIGLSTIIQLHYLALLLFPAMGAIWLSQIYFAKGDRKKSIALLQQLFIGMVIFIVSLTPLVLFDSKHDWLNAHAFYEMFFGNSEIHSSTVPFSEKLFTALKETHGRSMHILFEITIGKMRSINTTLLIAFILFVLHLLNKRPKYSRGLQILTLILMTSILGTSFYEHTVFDHYIAYLFPVTLFLLAIVLYETARIRVVGPIVVLIFSLLFVLFNSRNYPLKSLGWTINDTKNTADTILNRVKPNEKYNIVHLSPTGDLDGLSYRYFLQTSTKPPVVTEERGSVETLFIIDDEFLYKKSTDSPVYEIVVFPNKNPAEIYAIEGGPTITVLRSE